MEWTVKCPICGRWYTVYSHTVLDQSTCGCENGSEEYQVITTNNTETEYVEVEHHEECNDATI